MILLAHMLFGAAIGALIGNPILAIFLALLGHYFLDIFPHIEYLDSVESSIKELKAGNLRKNSISATKVLLDFLLGLILIYAFSNNHPIVYICALIAIVPDGLTVISKLFPNKISDAHDYIHTQKIHYLTKQKKFPIYWKIITQVAVVIMSIIILQKY